MSGLNSVVRALTGPRRLRLALREKTAPIHRLLDALDGPSELQVRIPASVFGGDIFGVMSQHLREALIVPPQPEAPALKPQRKRMLRATDYQRKDSQDPLPPQIVDWLKQSTLPGESVAAVHSTTPASIPLDHNMTAQNSVPFYLGPQTSRRHGIGGDPVRFDAGETLAILANRTTELTASSTATLSPDQPALVNSLRRYWELLRERPETNHAFHPTAPGESFTTPDAARVVSEFEKRLRPRPWPGLAGRDVSEELRSFTDGSTPPLKSARLNSPHDHQTPNVFNFELDNANQHAPNYDDLGERIAQVLHEQALQHGIDVT